MTISFPGNPQETFQRYSPGSSPDQCVASLNIAGSAVAAALAAHRNEGPDEPLVDASARVSRSANTAPESEVLPSWKRRGCITSKGGVGLHLGRKVDGVHELKRLLTIWVRERTYANVAPVFDVWEDAEAFKKIAPAAERMMDRAVAGWRTRGVFCALIRQVMARYERDGTLAREIDRIEAENPFKSRDQAEQEARDLLCRWDGDVIAKRAKFDLMLRPEGDLRPDGDTSQDQDQDRGPAEETAKPADTAAFV